MKQLKLLFVAGLIFSALGCAESETGGFIGSDRTESTDDTGTDPSEGEGSEAEDSGSSQSACKTVENAKFWTKIHGTWQPYHPGSNIPFCMTDSSSGQVVRSFIRFDEYRQTFDSYKAGYGPSPGGVIPCIDGGVGTGTRISSAEPAKVELCQTPELIENFGSDYYFLKSESGYYTIVSSTDDSLGRTVLLISRTTANHSNIEPWLSEDASFQPYIDHNDFKSVKVNW